ncbi:hypothetical protein A5752_03630 [Mycobacterium sp. 852002-51961_SCH5331710]|nr:hypothetical protein A5752_03630 [Mycobacterium sp. 852002-51961_SCH5331710]
MTPRQVQPRSPKKTAAIVAAVIGVFAAVAGLIFWSTRPSPDDAQRATPTEPPTASAPPTTTAATMTSQDDTRLLRQLPKGYPAGACESTLAPEGVLSQVDCAKNGDPDGPESATFSLVRDRASLEKTFNDTIGATVRVDCPGKIQSPGPWRRNATPDRISGQLYCGLQNGQPTVVWTDEEKMTVSAVRAGPTGPTFPQLYAWWSSHS